MSFERRVDDQVYSLPDILRNFTVRARSGLARDVGRGGYQRPVQLADQLLAELVLGNPDAERTLLGDQVLGDGAGSRQDQRQRLVGHFVQLPCDIGDFPDIKRHFVGVIQQYEHAFFLAASLEPVDALDGFVVSRVASDAPDRVRRIEDDTAFAQHFESLINRFVSHILTSV